METLKEKIQTLLFLWHMEDELSGDLKDFERPADAIMKLINTDNTRAVLIEKKKIKKCPKP